MLRMARPYASGALAALGLLVLAYALAVRVAQRWAGRRCVQTAGGASSRGS